MSTLSKLHKRKQKHLRRKRVWIRYQIFQKALQLAQQHQAVLDLNDKGEPHFYFTTDDFLYNRCWVIYRTTYKDKTGRFIARFSVAMEVVDSEHSQFYLDMLAERTLRMLAAHLTRQFLSKHLLNNDALNHLKTWNWR